MSDGIKKVATFLSGLDCKTVDMLIQRLDPATAAAVRRELLVMQEVPAAEQTRTTNEFVRDRQGRPHSESDRFKRSANGIDTFEHSSPVYGPPGTANRLKTSYPESKRPFRAAAPEYPSVKSPPAERLRSQSDRDEPFAFLHEAPSRSLAKMLLMERPQTIAIVLAHLAPELAASLLAGFPAPLQIEVMKRLNVLDEIDREVLADVEQSLRERLESLYEEKSRRRLGPEAVARILKASDPKTRTALIANLRKNAESVPSTAFSDSFLSPADHASSDNAFSDHTVSARRIDFDDLNGLGDEELAFLFASLDRRIGMIALVGADPAFINRIVGRYTPAQQRKLRQQLAAISPIRPEDIREAKEIVLREAERLSGVPS